MSFQIGFRAFGLIEVSKYSRDVRKYVARHVSPRSAGREGFVDKKIDSGSNDRIVESINEITVNFHDRVVFENRSGVVFQVDRVIDIVKEVLGHHDCCVRSSVSC